MTQGKPPYDPAPYIALLEQALASPYGVEVDAGSQLANHRQRFYNSRRGRADLEKVKVRTSINNPTTHLWLIPESVEETYNAQEKSNVAAPGTDNGDPE